MKRTHGIGLDGARARLGTGRNPGRFAGIVAGLSLCALLGGCEFLSGSTGGSETTNGLTGVILDGDGKPVPQAAVVLLPETYNPVPGKDARALRRTVTDARGRYRFPPVASGVYNLEAKDARKPLLLLVQGIAIDSGKAAVQADGVLATPGVLQIPFADRHLPENAQAYIPGTTYNAFTASKVDEGILTLANLAPGRYKDMLALSPDLPDGGPISVTGPFRIGPDSTTRLDPLQAWNYSAPIAFDASALASQPASQPAAALGALTGYPMLVRLDAGHFDFTLARSGGEDIRFTRKDGTLLPHHIERWDAAAKTAALWVRMDSLPAASADSALIMHWGRVDAVDASRPDLVFDTSLGFSSVWHLGESANAAAGGYRDATAAGNHATASPPNADGRVDAPVGSGKRFSAAAGPMSAALPAGLGGNASFTVTYWMRFAMTPGRAGILAFGQPATNRGIHFLIRSDTTAQFGPWDVSPDSADSPSAQQNHFSLAPWLDQWAFVATVYESEAGTLATWIDGVRQAVNTLPPLAIAAGSGLTLGLHVTMVSQPQSDFLGSLDEVRVYDRAVPEAWIRMDFATQKEGSAVLRMP